MYGMKAGLGHGHIAGRGIMVEQPLDFRNAFHGVFGYLNVGVAIRYAVVKFQGHNLLISALKWSIIQVMTQKRHKIEESSIFRGIMKICKNNFRINLTFL